MHQLHDGLVALGIDQPETSRAAIIGTEKRSGRADLRSMPLEEIEMRRHQALADVGTIGVVREQYGVKHGVL